MYVGTLSYKLPEYLLVPGTAIDTELEKEYAVILAIVGLPARQETPWGTHAFKAWEVRPLDGTELEQSIVRHLSRQASPVHWPATFLVTVAFVSAHTHLHSSPESLQAAFSPSLAWLCQHVLECAGSLSPQPCSHPMVGSAK